MDSGSMTTSSSVGKLGKAGVTVKSLSSDDGSMIIVGILSEFFDGTAVIPTSTSGFREESFADATLSSFFLQTNVIRNT
jgi:hypothetical protein